MGMEHIRLTQDTLKKEPLCLRNIHRAIALTNQTIDYYFSGNNEDLKMLRFYNVSEEHPSSEVASIWMYGSSFEAITAILKSLIFLKKKGYDKIYDDYFPFYKKKLKILYHNADYYLGSFQLTSYTQTKKWTVYGVNRSDRKGEAAVRGKNNVYDDQMWLIRDFLDAFIVTKDSEYLAQAEYLTSYVLDGWDCSIDKFGNEVGGITWGPGYVTKHACSNGPLISSLVRLYKWYKNSNDRIEYHYIDSTDRKTRRTRLKKKSDYYLSFARKVYNWEKKNLLDSALRIYDDMLGNPPDDNVLYDTIDGKVYRKSTELRSRVRNFVSYNCGTMLSGGAALYDVTKDVDYLKDAKELSEASFNFFAKKSVEKKGYYTFKSDGFNGWFNGVLFRGFADAAHLVKKNADYMEVFQKNLDFAYGHYLKKGLLPVNLLKGWGNENKMEGMVMFAYAEEYAILVRL